MSAISHALHTDASALSAPPTPGLEGFKAATSARDRIRLQQQLDVILKHIKTAAVEEAVEHAFTTFSRLRELLRIIELNVNEGGSLPVTLAAFALVESEAKSLVRYIESSISRVKTLKGPLREMFDGMSFTIRHELRRVFGHDLLTLDTSQPARQLRADLLRAHGLLTNCFEQSTLALVRVFEPSTSGELLFEDYRARLKQSAELLSELSALLGLARRASDEPEGSASNLLMRELKSFCTGTMHCLMYKDWDEFEQIVRDVTASRGTARHGFMLHCFAIYLEALITQVRMRAVLNDQAFELPKMSVPAPAAKAPRRAAKAPQTEKAKVTRMTPKGRRVKK